MKTLGVLATVFLLTSVAPAFALPSNYQISSGSRVWRWDTKNIKMSDIRFNPEFLLLSVPASESDGSQFKLKVQCGNNPNFYYKVLDSSDRSLKMGKDQGLVTQLCIQAAEIRDEYVRQLLATETCTRINLQYGIRSIPVAQFGDTAKKKDRNNNGFACDL
jgi:hypothetical protein